MKKFTTLLAGLFVVIGVYAQNPVITKLWDWSIEGSKTVDEEGTPIPGIAPTWMGSSTERGMAFFDGKIYVASRKSGNEVVVLDAETGQPIPADKITLPANPVSGGTLPINTISITPDGAIYIGNLTANTKSIDAGTSLPNSPFKVYKLTPKVGEAGYDITTVINWNNVGNAEQPAYRIGDGMGVYVNEDEDGYIITGDATGTSTGAFVLRWDIIGGVVAAEPVVITLKEVFPAPAVGVPNRLGTAPQFWPLDLEYFFVDGANTQPMLFDMEGNMIGTFNGTHRPKTPAINGLAYFNFKGRDFIVAATCGHGVIAGVPKASFEAFELVGGDLTQAVSYGIIPEGGLGGLTNASVTNPVAIDILPNEVRFYVMSSGNGIAGFKLTLESGTSVTNPETKSSVSVYPVPATDVLNFSVEMASIELYNISGQLVRKAINTNKINVHGLNGSFIVKGIDVNGQPFNKMVVVK